MFDAHKTELEIKKNVVDFILDWKNLKNKDVRNKVRALWSSATPQEGSILSELLVENNYSFITDEDAPTIETLDPEFFQRIPQADEICGGHPCIRRNAEVEKWSPVF